MGFRTLEISHAAELHIKEGQLEITTDDGVAVVPIEDLNQIMLNDPPKMVYRSTKYSSKFDAYVM